LVWWCEGAYLVGALLELFLSEQPPLRDLVCGGTHQDLENFRRRLAGRMLLVAVACRWGLEPERARVDSLAQVVRAQLLEAARSLGLTRLDQAPGEDRRVAVARAVRQALADNIAGATRIVPLGLVGFQLRGGVPIVISGSGVGRAILRIAEVRAGRSPSPFELSRDSAAAAGAAPDTTGP
jgi:hypothetical protein